MTSSLYGSCGRETIAASASFNAAAELSTFLEAPFVCGSLEPGADRKRNVDHGKNGSDDYSNAVCGVLRDLSTHLSYLDALTRALADWPR
jgi:hypothetical protein